MVKIVDICYQKLEKAYQNTNAETLTASFGNYLKGTRYISILFSIFALSLILFSLFLPNLEPLYQLTAESQQKSDFANYLEACESLLAGRLDLIYNIEYMIERGYGIFRYFPSMLLIFTPFVLINNYQISLFVFSISNVVLVLYINYLVAKIIVKLKLSPLSAVVQSLSMFFIFFTIESIYQGQIVMTVAAILLNAMIKLIEGKDFQAALLIGVATFFKPVTIVLIAVLLLSPARFTTVIKYLVGIALPLIPDMILFVSNPGMIMQYINVNSQTLEIGAFGAPRCDLTNLFNQLTKVPQIYLFAGFLIIGVLLASRILPKIIDKKWKIVFIFVFSTAIYQASQADMWTSQMPLVYPFIAISGALITNKAELSRYRAWFLLYQLPIYSLVFSYFMAWLLSPDIFFISICTSSLAFILTAMFIWSWLKPAIVYSINPKLVTT